MLAIQEKRWPLAEAFLSGSLQIEPDDAKTNYLLAQVRFERNDVDGARAALADAMRLRPGDVSFQKLSTRVEARRDGATP